MFLENVADHQSRVGNVAGPLPDALFEQKTSSMGRESSEIRENLGSSEESLKGRCTRQRARAGSEAAKNSWNLRRILGFTKKARKFRGMFGGQVQERLGRSGAATKSKLGNPMKPRKFRGNLGFPTKILGTYDEFLDLLEIFGGKA